MKDPNGIPYKKMGKNQIPMTKKINDRSRLKNYISNLNDIQMRRISLQEFQSKLEGTIEHWSSSFVPELYKPFENILSGECLLLKTHYNNEQYDTYKWFSLRPCDFKEVQPNLSAYTVWDMDVTAFKADADGNIIGDAVYFAHQKPQYPHYADSRSPHVEGNDILSTISYDNNESIESLSVLSAFADFNSYIDERIISSFNLFNVPNAFPPNNLPGDGMEQ